MTENMQVGVYFFSQYFMTKEKEKQEMFVKHWPPARSKWNTCLDLHLTYM